MNAQKITSYGYTWYTRAHTCTKSGSVQSTHEYTRPFRGCVRVYRMWVCNL